MNTQRKDIFSDKMFRKLWIPSMLTAVGLAFGDMADAVVVGQKMGAVGLAAVSLVLPVFMVINIFVHGFGIGGSVRYSKYVGQGHGQEAVASFNQIFALILLISIFCSAAGNLFLSPLLRLLGVQPGDGLVYEACREYVRVILYGMPVLFSSYLLNYYLRNDNNQNLAVVGFTVGNLSDLGMNILFVLILDMGVLGAAISTVLGQAIAICIYLPGFFGKRNLLRFQPKQMLQIQWKECFSCFFVGLSSSIEHFWHFIFFLIINHALMYYAGENGVAVFDMVQNMSFLIFYLYEYTAKAMQPLLSTYYGEHNRGGIYYVLKKGLISGSVCGITVALLLAAFPSAVSLLFGLDSPELIAMGDQAVRIFCIGTAAAGCSIILENYYQSCEDGKPAYLLSTLRSAIVLIPAALVLIPFGMPYLWLFYPLTEFLSLGIFLLLAKRVERKPFDPERIYSRIIENKNEDFSSLLGEIEAFSEKWDADARQIFLVNMAAEELCGIILKRAFTGQQAGFLQITLVALPNHEFELHIRDNGQAFDPFSQKAEKVGNADSDVDTIGILVIREKAKDFFYHQYQGFNTLVVRI